MAANRPNEATAATESRRVTVLEGYYASGDHECFCFDKWDGPEAYRQAFPDWDSIDEQIEAQNANRVYPDDLLPERTARDGRSFGRWRITVEFEPMEEPK